jgi:hypothetical protein
VSDTPRTDAKAHTHPFFYVEAMYVSADFARELERENAALRHSEESLASTVRGLEFELEKADAALDWLNTHCMSADPIMGRSTYRWTIEHDEPDIRAAIAELRKAQV